MARDIGIDLGTANTLIYMKGKGIILREPSVVAVDIRNDTVKFVGDEAKEVVGRTPASIVAVRPLKDGVIADFDIAASMLQLFIKKTLGSVTFNRPRVVICIPSGVTAVERRAVREVAFKAGDWRGPACGGAHRLHGGGYRRRHRGGGGHFDGLHRGQPQRAQRRG